MKESPTIIYTKTDEAPALATYSLFPIVSAFARTAGIRMEMRDISLAARILSRFSDYLPGSQRIEDDLGYLGKLTQEPGANIIKLPNISASVPQLLAAIGELQEKGYAIPDYPHDPANKEESEIRSRYDKVKGSAVNPVLREGNSDRRAPRAVKAYARNHPHAMGEWSRDSKTRVATMGGDDFAHSEQSVTLKEETEARIEFIPDEGEAQVLKASLQLEAGEVLDASSMSKRSLLAFLRGQVDEARQEGILFSLHLKATMMKVSDPVIFGHAVRVYFEDLAREHKDLLGKLGVDFKNGLGDLMGKLDGLSEAEREEVEASLKKAYEDGPRLAMVNSDRGITNLHVPSDIIVDASMPAMIRSSGKMWNADGGMDDTLAVIPDSSYAGVYQTVIDDCRENGAFDPKTMGSVPNVGLMARKAEEYGSHDKTFEIPAKGRVRVVSADGTVLTEHEVEEGDIWRACQTKDVPIREWVRLAVSRARETGDPAVFWLDRKRAHDAELIRKVEVYLKDHDTSGLELPVMPPTEACAFSLERARKGLDTISVTGNVLRDYLTDLFPILEVGTSAKMLSIVPLINGGGLFETGAGGSAPKHVQQFVAENYLRWDSLGEFLALAVSLEHLAGHAGNDRARLLAVTLDQANGRFLEENKSPTRKLGGIDNRGSHFYLMRYWAEALVAQDADSGLKQRFTPIARMIAEKEEAIIAELIGVQGQPVDIGGYYWPDEALVEKAMRPSDCLNRIIWQI